MGLLNSPVDIDIQEMVILRFNSNFDASFSIVLI